MPNSNSKELQTELGKYDYGARMYDAVVGRWSVVEALSENHYSINPYNYVLNNPINTIDPFGLDTTKASSLNLDTWRNFKTNKDVIGLNEVTISTNRGEQRAVAAYSAILADVQRNYRVGVGGLFQGYPDNLQNVAAERFYSKYIKYNEINPFTGEMRVIGLEDANWIIDLASGGIISLVRTGASISAANGITTSDGFLFGGFTVKAPFNIPVQRFGNMSIRRPDFWGARIGASKFANRTFGAIDPAWNPLTQFTTGIIPKGTPIQFGIIGPQGWRYPGGVIPVYCTI